MYNLPMDTTIVLLIVIGLIVINIIGIAVQLKRLPKEEENKKAMKNKRGIKDV